MRFWEYGLSKHHFRRLRRTRELEERGIRIEERGDWRKRWVCLLCCKASSWLWNGVFGSADRHLASQWHCTRVRDPRPREEGHRA